MAQQLQQQVVQQVIINQPGPAQNKLLVGSRNGTREWTTGLCGCMEDIPTCLATIFCNSCAVCSVAVRVGDGFCMPMCVPDAPLTLRVRVRTLGDIRGSICQDCMATTFCPMCAVCQMQRELEAMGL